MSNLATLQPAAIEAHAGSVSTQAMVFDFETVQNMQRIAEMMAAARVTVPKHLAGSPGDCLAIVMQAAQWQMNPFAVAQKTHLVNGVLGYEAQLVNAVVSASGAIKGRFRYEYRGEGSALECRVGAIPAGESDVVWGEWLAASSVTTKNSPLWKTNPRQQLGYLQVKNWARQYTPGAILGVYTADELQDAEPRNMGEVQVVDSGPGGSRTEGVKAKLAAKRSKKPAPQPSAELQAALDAIAAAETTSALKKAGALAAGLEADAEKDAARGAYASRATELKEREERLAETLLRLISEATDGDQVATYMDDAGELSQPLRERVIAAADARTAELQQS